MDAGTTSSYRNRNRKRPLDGRPCNSKVKRRLFPADVAAEMESSLRERQRHVIARSSDLLAATAETMFLLVDMGWYSDRELDPLFRSLRILVSDAISACRADGAPVEVPPDLYQYYCHDPKSKSYEDSTSSSSPPPPLVEKGGRGAAFVVRSKRQAKANSKYYGPQWTKK